MGGKERGKEGGEEGKGDVYGIDCSTNQHTATMVAMSPKENALRTAKRYPFAVAVQALISWFAYPPVCVGCYCSCDIAVGN